MSLTFLPDRPTGELIDQARSDVAAWERQYTTYGQSSQDLVRGLAGYYADSLLTDPNATRSALRSSNPSQRLAAACLAFHYWTRDCSFASACLELAFHDPEPAVRGAALAGLPWVRSSIDDPTGVLARIISSVLDVKDSRHVKYNAELALTRATSIKAELLEWVRRAWREAAGDSLDRILESPESALWHIENHESALIRRVAISVLLLHFKQPTRAAADIGEMILRMEEDTELRTDAITLIADFYKGTNDLRIGRLLAEIVCDDTQPVKRRRLAYYSLFQIRGVSYPGLPKPFEDEESQFPESINWELVVSFLEN